jgi:hypothetical protein|tara:strand:+ start:742 stop:900 length:159 start_codon:yes stop_codon:yes gene_type:complete
MKHEIILDDFAKRDSEFISELVYDALVDIGYQDKGRTIENLSWQIKVNLESS